MSVSAAARPPKRAARYLLPRSMTADRTRLRNFVRRQSRPISRKLCPNCSIFATVLRASIRQACYRHAARDGREDVIARAAAASRAVGTPSRACFWQASSARPQTERAPTGSVRSARRLRPCSGSCSSSMPLRSGPTARYQAATQKLRLVERQLRVNRQALGVARGNFAHAQHTLAKRLVALYTSQSRSSRRSPSSSAPAASTTSSRASRPQTRCRSRTRRSSTRWSGTSTRSPTARRSCAASVRGRAGSSPSARRSEARPRGGSLRSSSSTRRSSRRSSR